MVIRELYAKNNDLIKAIVILPLHVVAIIIRDYI